VASSALDILRNCNLAVEGYTCTGMLYGSPMRRLRLSSRTIFTAHDMPYVVKAEFGYGYRQSWNEWVFWHRTAAHSEDAAWFAATHGMKIGMIEAECFHKHMKPRPGCECRDTPWYVIATVQERILDAGKAFKMTARKRACLAAQAYVGDNFPGLFDVREWQFVYSARRAHGVLVDYGMHGAPDDVGDETLEPALWNECVRGMRMGEWRMFDVPIHT